MSVFVLGGAKTLVVDDHELFLRKLIELLRGRPGVRVVGQASRGQDAIEMAAALKPDVVLMDINMPGMSGIEATLRIKAAAAHVKVVIMTAMADEPVMLDAIHAGACGYILKDTPIEQIVEAIRAAVAGGSPLSPSIAGKLLAHLRNPIPANGADLTPREQDVLDLIVQGLENSEIAGALYLSEHTIKNHVSNIIAKLHVTNRVQAAVKAVRRKAIDRNTFANYDPPYLNPRTIQTEGAAGR